MSHGGLNTCPRAAERERPSWPWNPVPVVTSRLCRPHPGEATPPPAPGGAPVPSAPSLLREDSAWAKTRSGGARLLSGSPWPPASCRRLAVGGQVSTLRRHQLAARGAGSAASQGGTHPGPPPPAGSRGRTGSRRAPTRTRTSSGAQQDTGASTHPCSQRRRVRTRTAHTRRPCLYTQPRPERGRPRGDPSVTTRPHRSPRPLRAWQLGPALPFPRFFHGPFRRQRLSQHFRLVYRAVREHFVSAPAQPSRRIGSMPVSALGRPSSAPAAAPAS